MLRDIFPKRLFPRALLIIAAPLVLLQSILTFVSMERHWERVTDRLSAATAQDISALIGIYDQGPKNPVFRKLLLQTATNMKLRASFEPNAELPPTKQPYFFDILDTLLNSHLASRLNRPYWIDAQSYNTLVEIRVKLDNEILRILTTRKQTYASNSHIFLTWMVGSSSVLLLVAVLFLRNQIKPILQLADAAERFGRGLPPPTSFKPRGALEVRKAAIAFLNMRNRIERHVEQRTTMLAGVSHDLRTILTRFKLELALIGDSHEIVAMRKDVEEMQNMINAYMDFAKGEGNEATSPTHIDDLLHEIRDDMARVEKKVAISSNTGDLVVDLRRNAFKRAVTNLVANATRHGDKVAVTAEVNEQQLLLHVDDNGPGIPADLRDKVFQPFVRLDDSRSQLQGGSTGLGLSIARDIVHSHGGSIILGDSPLGGLQATITLPL